jgi:G3E family GTPase
LGDKISTEPVPLRVFFGWSGSGKSTVIEALAAHARSRSLVRDDGRTDLIASLEAAVEESPDSQIFIEADSTLEPIAIAELFYLEGENGEPPDDRFEIQTVATVVDSRTLFDAIQNPKSLIELDLEFDEFDDRTDADVIIEQIEFSDVVVLNRTSDISPETIAKARGLIEWLNPRAQLVEVPQDGCNREFIEEFWQACGRTVFDFDEAAEGAGWIQLLANSHPKIDRGVGISSIGIRARRPLHPERFKSFIDTLPTHQIVRIKGWIWIATRNGETGIWSVAGPSSILAAAGAWMAATPMREWPEDPIEREDIMSDWVPPYGDRRQEIAIMGFDLNDFELRRAFKACLLSDEEFALGPEGWAKWHDPLPDWSVDSTDDFDGVLQ